MNRRNFLKAIGVGVGYLALPAWAKPNLSGVSDYKSLEAAMEEMFICKEGAASAFMEFDRLAASQFLTKNAYQAVAKDNQVIRVIYQSFAYAIEGGSEDEAQAKLSQYFYDEFKEIAKGDEKKMLIWRVKPSFSTEEVTKFGKTWMTSEQIEDRTDLVKDYEIKTEGYVHPTYGDISQWAYTVPKKENTPPIMVPDGVEYDFMTDSLRYVESKTKLHKLRMRLVIPEVMFDEEEYHPLAKPDGSTIPRLMV